MAATIEIKGLKDTLRRLKKYGEGVEKEVKAELYASALDIQRDAVSSVAVDTGALKQSSYIKPIPSDLAAYEVGFTKDYAPYVEFGTGTTVEVPTELQEYASQYRGTGQREVNLPARPFLFPAFVKNGDALLANLKRLLRSKKL